MIYLHTKFQTPNSNSLLSMAIRLEAADLSGRAVWVDLRPLACWDCGFESRRGHGFVCVLLCVVRKKSLRRADHSSREVLPTVMRRCVWSRNVKNEEAMARVGPQHHRKKKTKVKPYLRTPHKHTGSKGTERHPKSLHGVKPPQWRPSLNHHHGDNTLRTANNTATCC